MQYCSTCGHELQTIQQDTQWYCANCKRDVFANPVPTIDAVLFDEKGRILLGRRRETPGKGKLNLPGGFVDMNETLEEALARELKEELGLNKDDYSPFVYAGSRIDYYLRYGQNRQLITVVMYANTKHRDLPSNDEVSEYVWKLPAEIKQTDVTNKREHAHIQQVVKLRNHFKS